MVMSISRSSAKSGLKYLMRDFARGVGHHPAAYVPRCREYAADLIAADQSVAGDAVHAIATSEGSRIPISTTIMEP